MSAEDVPHCLPALDAVNLRAYQNRHVLEHYAKAAGWLEPGEQRACEFVAERVRGKPVLDIGVGGGRTAPLLRQISADYRGIDYAPRMIALARKRFPDAAFLQMDARDLRFADGRFGLVAFTFNGIDSIDLAGRQQVLSEVFRVLMPGGFFAFSALNHGRLNVMRHWPDWGAFQGTGLSPTRLARAGARLALGGVNRVRHWWLVCGGADVAVGHLAAHNFSLVTLYVSVREQVRMLHAAGFALAAVFEPDGSSMPADPWHDTGALWYHYVAQKPG